MNTDVQSIARLIPTEIVDRIILDAYQLKRLPVIKEFKYLLNVKDIARTKFKHLYFIPILFRGAEEKLLGCPDMEQFNSFHSWKEARHAWLSSMPNSMFQYRYNNPFSKSYFLPKHNIQILCKYKRRSVIISAKDLFIV
jgi:hypothetical protein